MATQISLAEIRKRIDAVTATVKDRARRLARMKPEQEGEGQKADSFDARAGNLRGKLPESEGSAWDAVQHEVERDLKALEQDFDHWVRYIDRHFEEQGGTG